MNMIDTLVIAFIVLAFSLYWVVLFAAWVLVTLVRRQKF